MEHQNTQRLLFGINVSVFGVILALTGGGGIALIVGLFGLAISATGMVQLLRTP